MTQLLDAVAQVFSADGALSLAEPAFLPRSGQTRMALAVAQAIEEGDVLVVEAGTGVGKTYAYLVPALLSGQRVLVSTATKALQDQLFARDLPRLVHGLGLPLRMARLKGRASYLCIERLERVRQGRTAPQDPQVLRTVADVERWARITRTGDLAEMTALDERSPAVPLVTSTKDNCLGSDCPHWQACHVNLARQQALDADVVVVNHHLLFADLDVRDSGMANLLPNTGVVVVDEAHQLNDIGVQFAGDALSSQQLVGYARDALRVTQEHARGMADWLVLCATLEQAMRELRLQAGKPTVGGRLPWQGITPQGLDGAKWRAALVRLGQSLRALLKPLAVMEAMAAELQRLYERGVELLARLARFAAPADDDCVRWLEVGTQHLRMLESPLSIARIMQQRLLQRTLDKDVNNESEDRNTSARKTWIFTSATLGNDARLSWFTDSCGLHGAKVLQVESPFDYHHQAGVYVPQPFAAAGSAQHSPQVAQLVLDAAQRIGGRTLVLTTTLKALHAIRESLRSALGLFADLDVLVQGEAPKLALIQRFMAAGASQSAQQRGAILVASATFWEGVDLPGDVLQLVVIDKLPFPPPDDPLVEARSRQLERVGRAAFHDYMIPEAALALKQGAGRLIRSESDRGVLVICDSRLVSMGYGGQLMAALPPMRVLGSQSEFEEALEQLAAERSHGKR
ncbi:ATP-dependent DNA helicase [Comamonas sp. 26]|uniref:ATP-dependent DNA helicase n=1 Tax=Comamonas sp. 26 TaxID=2035201 RepID=UPI000C18D290|nr:ATP-dependent DNA helicase [Comamonas sp. 26]PIG09220.1 ATP-dependent DNA helicase DinG [Comamonas sp. 26]